VPPLALATLIQKVQEGAVSSSGARPVFDSLWKGVQVGYVGMAVERDEALALEVHVEQLIDELGLRQMSDTTELERILDEVLATNAKSVEEFRAGKEKAFNALVGQAMKATKGKANPAAVNDLLKKKLGA